VPALLLGLALRIAFMISVPEGYFGSDSNSYFDTAHELWNAGKWKMGDKRAGVYPLVLLAGTVMPGSTVQAVAVLQHAVGLAALVAVGWIAGHFTGRPALWIPVITCIYTLLPQPLWFEHELIADSFLLNGFIFAVALALPITRMRTPSGLFWFLIAAALLVALKPHGRPLWLGLVCAAVVPRRKSAALAEAGSRCHSARDPPRSDDRQLEAGELAVSLLRPPAGANRGRQIRGIPGGSRASGPRGAR
jgi:hypothetical protein